jgi:hypothetical protein
MAQHTVDLIVALVLVALLAAGLLYYKGIRLAEDSQ